MDKHVKQANCPKGGPHNWVSSGAPGTMQCSKCAKSKQVTTKGKKARPEPTADPAS